MTDFLDALTGCFIIVLTDTACFQWTLSIVKAILEALETNSELPKPAGS